MSCRSRVSAPSFVQRRRDRAAVWLTATGVTPSARATSLWLGQSGQGVDPERDEPPSARATSLWLGQSGQGVDPERDEPPSARATSLWLGQSGQGVDPERDEPPSARATSLWLGRGAVGASPLSPSSAPASSASRRDCAVRPAGRSSRRSSSTLSRPASAGTSASSPAEGDLRRPGRLGEPRGQPPGQIGELAPRPNAHAAHAVHLDEREPQQVVDGADAHPLDRVHGAGAEPHRREQGVEARLLDAAERGRRAHRVGVGFGTRRRQEELAPRAQHLFGVVEAPAVVAAQRLAEERGEVFADRRLERVGVDGGFAVEDGRLALPVAPPRQRPRRHLVQRDGRREPLGVGVPAGRLARLQERVEVVPRARQDVLGRRAREREVEEHEVELAADLGRAEVVGLDVAVGDALLLQPVDGGQQVFAEALEQLQVQAALVAQPVGERAVARAGHQQPRPFAARAVAERELVVQLDDVLVAQPAQHVRLGAQAVVVVGRQRHLEHVLAPVALDEQGQRRAPLAEPPLHDEAVAELVAGAGLDWVGPGTLVGTGQLFLDPFQLFQELADRGEPRRHRGMGGVLHEKLEALADPVEVRRDLQALLLPQPLGHRREARRRRTAREEVVGDGPEREHVYLLARRAALGHRLGGHVDPRALLDERVEPARPHRGRPRRPRAGRVARPRLPVEDLHPRLRRPGVDDQDALRRQRPVDQALRMREVHGLGDLAEQVQPGVDVEAGAALRQPVVEAPRALAVLEDERRPAHVLGVPLGRQDALVPHVAQNLVFAPGRPLQRRPLVVRCGRGDRVDADPRALAVDRRVARRPVLVARPFEEERVEPVVAQPPRALRRADARLLHGAADRLGHRPVDARAGRRAGAVPGERGDDAGALVPPRPRVAAVHVAAQVVGEPAVDVLVRQEDVGLQKRARRLLPQRRLAAQERDQLLRLAVREQQRGCRPSRGVRRRATSTCPGCPPRRRAGS